MIDGGKIDHFDNESLAATYKLPQGVSPSSLAPIKPNLTWEPVILASQARVKSNTQVQLPENLYLGDLNGDGIDDFIQVSGSAGSGNHNRIMVFGTNANNTGMMHLYLSSDVVKLFTGNFMLKTEPNYGPDQLCVTTATGLLNCYLTKDGSTLSQMWSQPDPTLPDEQVIVGDFDGNGADDLLLYRPAEGAFRMFTRTSGTQAETTFSAMSGFSPGGLGSGNLLNLQLRAGQFASTLGADGLIAYDPQTGEVSYFNPVFSGANKTFATVFNGLAGNTFPPGPNVETIATGRIQAGTTDGILLRNVGTGAYRFFNAASSRLQLTPISGVVAGDLPAATGVGATFVFARLGNSGNVRDDTLFFHERRAGSENAQVTSTTAAFDTAQREFTYRSAYTANYSMRDQGWAPVQHDLWLVLRCEFPDDLKSEVLTGAAHPPGGIEPMFVPDTFIQNWLGKPGLGMGGHVDYFNQVTYGKIDFNIELRSGWNKMSNPSTTAISYGQEHGWPGAMRAFAIADCAVNGAGIPASQITGASTGMPPSGANFTNPKYAGILALWNRAFDSGNDGGNMTDLDVGYIHLTGSAHENLHAYGLRHPNTDVATTWCTQDGYATTKNKWDTEYCNLWDPMGADEIFTVSNNGAGDTCILCISTFGQQANEPGVNMADYPGGNFQPGIGGQIADPVELNAPHRIYFNAIPTPRISILMPTASGKGQQTATITLAALEKPEAAGALAIKIPACKTGGAVCGDPDDFYTVDYRQQTGWDAAITVPGILINEVKTNGVSYTPGKPPPGKWWYTILKTPPSASTLAFWPAINAVPLVAGQSAAYTESSVKITVNSINTTESNASITVNY
jgi:hypothetical protein